MIPKKNSFKPFAKKILGIRTEHDRMVLDGDVLRVNEWQENEMELV